jgi:putative ABC transport system permease protein
MLLYEVRHAFRHLLRERGFAATAVLTLSLGIGASVAVFAVVEATLLRPLPYEAAGELVVLEHRDSRSGITKPFIAIGDFVDLAARQTSFTRLAAYGNRPVSVFGPDGPFRGNALMAGPGLFEALGVRPALGRSLQPENSRPDAPPVVVLGAALWRTRFGSDPRIVGRGVKVGEELRQVVGIAPEGFAFPPDAPADVVLPLTLPPQAPADRKSGWTFAVARLAPGRSAERAGAELGLLSQQLQREYPQSNQGSEYHVVPLRRALVGDTRPALLLLLAAVGVVMLIACANVANLVLARGLARRDEMAVRMALGASRRRLVYQLAVESLVLSVGGSALALLAADGATRALVSLVPQSVSAPGLREAGVDGWVVGFAVGIAVTAAMLVAAAASVATWGDSASATLAVRRTTASAPARRVASGIVVAEVALSIMLVFGAALIARSFARLQAVDPGFRVDGVTTLDVAVPTERYAAPESRRAVFDRALAALRAVPGVQEVGAAVVTPLTGNNWTVGFERADRPVPKGERPPDVGWQCASGGYFRSLGIPLRSGRLFEPTDTPTTRPVVIVSEAVERRFFPGERAVGHAIQLGDTRLEIVGVVGDIRRARLRDLPQADLYFPFEQQPGTAVTLFLRTAPEVRVSQASLAGPLRAIEPDVVLGEPTRMADVLRESVQVPRLVLTLLSAFAAIALVLAGVGIYGVLSYVVRQRTREIGTRMALGANSRDVTWLVLREGGLITAVGTALGVAAGLFASRVLESILYATSRMDAVAIVASALLLALTTLAACLVPARRAARLDPARTLAEP